MRIFVVAHVGWAFDVNPGDRVGRLKELVIGKLRVLGVEDSSIDVRLAFGGRVLDDDCQSLTEAAITNGAKVLLISRALALWCAEKSKVRSLGDALEEAGGVDELSATPASGSDLFDRAKPFRIDCDVMDLGELGACWPLFFMFIRFLVFVCFFMFAVQLPFLVLLGKAPSENMLRWTNASQAGVISHWLLSAGNFGPGGSTTAAPSYCMAVCSLLLACAAMYHQWTQRGAVKTIDAVEIQPKDFGVFIEGLPRDATDEREIKEFLESNARNGERTEIVKVVIGFNVDEFNEIKAELKGKQAQLAEASDATKPLLQREFKDILGKLSSVESLTSVLSCSGCCVAVLRNQREHKECIQDWDSLSERFRRLFGKNSKPLFRDEHVLTISRAGEPSDMLWENLHIEDSARMLASVRTFAFMILVFAATSALVFASRSMSGTKKSFAAVSSLIVANIVISVCSKWFVTLEKHPTRTKQDTSLMVKMAVGMAFNYCIVPLLVHPNGDTDWYTAGGLAKEIWMLLILTPVVAALMHSIDIGSVVKHWVVYPLLGRSIESEKQTPETTQIQYNKLFLPSELGVSKTFAVPLKLFVATTMYMPMLPLAPLISACGLSVYYYAVKRKLLLKSKRPYRADYHIAKCALRFVFACSCVLPIFAYFLLLPSVQGRGADAARGCMVLTVVPLIGLLVFKYFADACFGWLGFQTFDFHDRSDEDYYENQGLWLKSDKYHTSHPVYQQLERIMLQQKQKTGRPVEWDAASGDFADPSGKLPARPHAMAPPAGGSTTVDRTDDDPGSDSDEDADDRATKAAFQKAAKTAGARIALRSSHSKLKPGMVVKVTSVADKEPPRWQGCLGTLVSFDVRSGRWKMLLESEMDARLPLDKLDAVEFFPGAEAKIVGLEGVNFQKLNGKTCRLVQLDENTGKWEAIVQGVHVDALLPQERFEVFSHA